MRVMVLSVFALLLLAGCAGDSGDGGTSSGTGSTGGSPTTSTGTSGTTSTTSTSTTSPSPEPRQPPEQTEFSFGPSAGCAADVSGSCISFEAGPSAPPVDGFWLGLSEDYWGLSFTSTVDSTLGDSDCWFVRDDASTIISDANQGAGPCAGKVPKETAYLFLYPYAEPASGMTVTFQV